MKKKIGLFTAVMVLAMSVFVGSPQAVQASSDDLTQEQLDVLLELEGAARDYYQDKIDKGQMPSLNDSQACEWKLTEPTKENRLAAIMQTSGNYYVFTTLICKNRKGETLAQAIYEHKMIDSEEVTSSDYLAKNNEWLEGQLFNFFDQTTNEWKSYTLGDYSYYVSEDLEFNYREPETEIVVHEYDYSKVETFNDGFLQDWNLPMDDLWSFLLDPQGGVSEIKGDNR